MAKYSNSFGQVTMAVTALGTAPASAGLYYLVGGSSAFQTKVSEVYLGSLVGGGIERAESLILDSIKKTVKKLALKDRSGAVAIISGSLGEEAVCLGAASLAAREIFLEI